MAYVMRDPIIIPTLVDDYDGSVEDRWGGIQQQGNNYCLTGRRFCSM